MTPTQTAASLIASTKRITLNTIAKQKRKAINIQRNIINRWGEKERSDKYRRAAAKQLRRLTTEKIEAEVLDGIFLNLNERSRSKSRSVQNRILRRIVEKRLSQANHHKYGRSFDLRSCRTNTASISCCLRSIDRKRHAI